MCGLAGLVGPPGDPSERAATAARMAATLAHRGPDDFGQLGRCARRGRVRLPPTLDHRPDPGGSPADELCRRPPTVVFNGEIYNFAALRDELQRDGHVFRGRSDTEVLLEAIERWGIEAALPRLWGMFAFAVWDAQERELHLVRDRLGKKPLYYGWQGETFLFGSELKALRAHPDFQAPIDRDALASYLRFSYVPVPALDLRRRPEASAGDAGSPSAPIARAEMPDPRPVLGPCGRRDRNGQEDPLRLSDDDAASELETAPARTPSGCRAVADVPLGAFLSGGIDSSTVVALMQAQSRPSRVDVHDRLRRERVRRVGARSGRCSRTWAPTTRSL